MKKIIVSLGLGLNLLLGFCPVFAANDQVNQLPLSQGNYDPIIKNNVVNQILDTGVELKDKTQITATQDIVRTIFTREYIDAQGHKRNGLLGKINIIVGGLAILWLVFIAARFIFSNGKEESLTKLKTNISYLILGLAIVSLAEFISYWIFDPTGEIANTSLQGGEAGTLLYQKFLQVKLFIQILVAGVMLILLGISGYKLIMSDGEEEKIKEEKQFLKTFVVGGFLILLSEAITKVISNKNPEQASTQGMNEAIGFFNYILSYVAVAAVFMLILSSIYYVTSLGNEESMTRAKKIIFSCVIGIVACISSYAIVTFVIRGL